MSMPPPPPGPGASPDPSPWPSAPSAPPAGQPAYPTTGTFAVKPPRPPIPAQGAMMAGGAVLIVIAAFLSWLTVGGESFNAFDLGSVDTVGEDSSSRGAGMMLLAVVIGGLGIATVAFRRNLAVVIIALVFAAIALIRALADIGDLNDLTNAFGGSVGAGVYVFAVGAAVALAGAIWGLTVRRQ